MERKKQRNKRKNLQFHPMECYLVSGMSHRKSWGALCSQDFLQWLLQAKDAATQHCIADCLRFGFLTSEPSANEPEWCHARENPTSLRQERTGDATASVKPERQVCLLWLTKFNEKACYQYFGSRVCLQLVWKSVTTKALQKQNTKDWYWELVRSEN